MAAQKPIPNPTAMSISDSLSGTAIRLQTGKTHPICSRTETPKPTEPNRTGSGHPQADSHTPSPFVNPSTIFKPSISSSRANLRREKSANSFDSVEHAESKRNDSASSSSSSSSPPYPRGQFLGKREFFCSLERSKRASASDSAELASSEGTE